MLPHSNVQQPRAATSNWREHGESAKTSNGTQQHNWWVMLNRFFHCLEGIQSTSNWKTSVGYSVDIIQEETSSAIWRHVPSQSNPVDLTSWEVILLHFTIHRMGKRPHRLSQGRFSWSKPRSTTSTHQTFYTAEFHNWRHRLANRQSTTPHKIVTRLWLAVRSWHTKILMYKK
jgi:hypothetical protein